MSTFCKIQSVSILFLSLVFTACGNLGATGGHRAEFLVTLTSLSPSSVMAGSPPFTLTVEGSNFQSAPQTLVWNGGQQLNATNVTASQATFTIDASMIANPGNISIQFIDGINYNQLSNALTLTVNPHGQTTCALFGTYDFLFTGFSNNQGGSIGNTYGYGEEVLAGTLAIDEKGNVSSEGTFVSMPFSTGFNLADTGTCTNSTTANEGTISIPFPYYPNYTFVIENGSSGIIRGRLAQSGEITTATIGTAPGSGIFVATPQNSVLGNGDYIFLLSGIDPSGAAGMGSPITIAGRFTQNNGNLSAGIADINDAGTVTTDVPVSGSLSTFQNVPSFYPPFTLNLTIGTVQGAFSVRVNSSGSGIAFGCGYPWTICFVGLILPQANAGFYANTSLNAPIVFSTWGETSPLYSGTAFTAASDTTIGLASGFDSNAGTFNLLFDNVSGGVANLNQTVTGATYNVASNGRATASYSLGGQSQNYVYYLDNANDGYILGLNNNAEFGFFQPQASGPFNTGSINGTFAAGTFLPLSPASPNLATEVTLNNGNLTASTPAGALTGTYSVAASGRGTATVNLPALGSNDLVLYVIDPQSVLLMGSDNTASDTITFMHF